MRKTCQPLARGETKGETREERLRKRAAVASQVQVFPGRGNISQLQLQGSDLDKMIYILY